MAEEGKRVSLRKIAKWLGVPWSSVYYKPRRKSTPLVDRAVEKAIYTLIQRHPRYGYRRITIMLKKKAGLIVNKKKVQRIMQRNGWGVNVRPKGFRPRAGASRSVSSAINERWATDMTHFFCKDSGWCHAIVVIDCWNREISATASVKGRMPIRPQALSKTPWSTGLRKEKSGSWYPLKE